MMCLIFIHLVNQGQILILAGQLFDIKTGVRRVVLCY